MKTTMNEMNEMVENAQRRGNFVEAELIAVDYWYLVFYGKPIGTTEYFQPFYGGSKIHQTIGKFHAILRRFFQ